jgi:hypothetical protein
VEGGAGAKSNAASWPAGGRHRGEAGRGPQLAPMRRCQGVCIYPCSMHLRSTLSQRMTLRCEPALHARERPPWRRRSHGLPPTTSVDLNKNTLKKKRGSLRQIRIRQSASISNQKTRLQSTSGLKQKNKLQIRLLLRMRTCEAKSKISYCSFGPAHLPVCR